MLQWLLLTENDASKTIRTSRVTKILFAGCLKVTQCILQPACEAHIGYQPLFFFYAEWPLFTVMIKVQSLIIYWMDEYNVYQRLFVLNGTHTAMAGYNMYIYKCRKSKNVANLLEHMAIDKLMSMRPDDPTCGLDKGIYLVHACRQISGPVMVIWVIGSLVKWPVSQGYQSIVFQNNI